tara:strand:+ start:126 stop:242 length:117 start_codon:yes stop_codon:yes gene_type:complete
MKENITIIANEDKTIAINGKIRELLNVFGEFLLKKIFE